MDIGYISDYECICADHGFAPVEYCPFMKDKNFESYHLSFDTEDRTISCEHYSTEHGSVMCCC